MAKLYLYTDQDMFPAGSYRVCVGGEYDERDLVAVYRVDDPTKTPWVQYEAAYVLRGAAWYDPNQSAVAVGDKEVLAALDPKSILQQEVATDPLARGYAGMTSNQIIASLNTRNRPWPGTTRLITIRTMLAELDPTMVATLYVKATTAAGSSPVMKMAVDMLTTYTTGGGLDVLAPTTAGVLASMQGVVFTADEVAAVLSLRYTTRAKELVNRAAVLADLGAPPS